ncbi:MAG: hypothetical protein ACOYM4_15250, partial [Nodosilinea sp.]
TLICVTLPRVPVESLIGATLQPRVPWLTNEVVNGINTTLGAALGLLLGLGAKVMFSIPLRI